MQAPKRRDFGIEYRKAPVVSLLLGIEAGDFMLELDDTFEQLRSAPLPRPSAVFEELALTIDGGGDGPFLRADFEFRGKFQLAAVVPFRLQTREACHEFIQALRHDAEIRLGLCRIETHQHLARFYPVAFLHQDLTDDAAGRVLDLLDMGVDDEISRRNHGPGQLRGRCPGAGSSY